ncbi:ganglioside-induced differentiation-associated protein 1-like [Glandiceps talaboti]
MSTSDDLLLYSTIYSHCARRVSMALIEKNLSYEKYEVDMLNSHENLTAWYLRLHPMGKVPVLRHNQHVITDSVEILEYLEDNFPDAPKLYPRTGTDEYIKVKSILLLIEEAVTMLDIFVYGLANFPEFARKPTISFEDLRLTLEARTTKDTALLEQLAEETEDLKDVCKQKITYLRDLTKDSNDRTVVEETTDKYDAILDEFEKMLETDAGNKRFDSLNQTGYAENSTLWLTYVSPTY